MLIFAKKMLIGNQSLKSSLVFFGSAMMDKLLLLMGGMYFFYWIGNLFSASFENDYGNFFENIGMLLLVYVATVVTSWMSKVVSDVIFGPIGFVLLTYLLAFPTLDSFLSMILAIAVGIFCILNRPDVKVLTWSLVGYWLLLFTVSSADYSISGALNEGFISLFIEIWTISWNAASYTVYNQAVSGIGGVLILLFGMLVTRLLNGEFKLPSYKEDKQKSEIKTEEQMDMAKSKKEVKQINEEIFNRTIDERVKERLQQKKIEPLQIVSDETEDEREKEETTEMKEETNEKNIKATPSSKAFFNISVPTLRVKINKIIEKELRRLSK